MRPCPAKGSAILQEDVSSCRPALGRVKSQNHMARIPMGNSTFPCHPNPLTQFLSQISLSSEFSLSVSKEGGNGDRLAREMGTGLQCCNLKRGPKRTKDQGERLKEKGWRLEAKHENHVASYKLKTSDQ